MTRFLCFAFLTLAVLCFAAPAVQAQYLIEQTDGAGYNPWIKGQTFTPNVGINPDPGAVASLNLREITFYRGGSGPAGPTSEFFLNIYDGDPVNGSGVFVGSSTNSIDVDLLGDNDPLTWTFNYLNLDYGQEYWALVSSTDTDGGLDVYVSMRESGGDEYTGGNAIAGTSSDKFGYTIKSNDLQFEVVLRDKLYFIEQTETAGYNPWIKGQAFTPSVGIDPDPGTVTTLDLREVTFYKGGTPYAGPTSEFYLNIYDGDPVNGSGVFMGSSTGWVDVDLLGDTDPITWTFDYLTLDYGHEYWALVSSTDTDGGLDVYVSMRESIPDVYLGGSAIAGISSDKFGYHVKPNDLGFEFDLDDTNSLIADAEILSVATGGTVNFDLRAGAVNAGRYYLILGSLSGSTPGIDLPNGGVNLPVNWDGLTDFVLAKLNSPTFTNFLAPLDFEGLGAAQINVGPVNVNKIGKVMTYAYCLEGENWIWDFASNPVDIVFVP